ncbi:hypothetical protein ACWER9_06625 [Micromonospora sp. NPDC003944]
MSSRFVIRPLGPWLGPITNPAARRDARRFRADWQDTLDMLSHEAELLGAQTVVLQVDVTEGEIRRDGMLRANARVSFPGVRVAIDSRHGPLTYATDQYDSWRANTRAVALSLEALRAVDRYGVSKRGEQYRGWTAIAANAAEMTLTPDEAARVLADASGVDATELRGSAKAVQAAYRHAVRTAHPDAGGRADVFRLLTAARDVLVGGRSS